MTDEPIRATHDNLDEHAEPVIAKWLVDAALSRTVLRYGEAKNRLEKQVGFSNIGQATNLGRSAEKLMLKIQEKYPNAPLLNALLVKKSDNMPGEGLAKFLWERYKIPDFSVKGVRENNKPLWQEYTQKAADEVYNFYGWPYIYSEVYERPYEPERKELLALQTDSEAKKQDHQRGHGGEGPKT